MITEFGLRIGMAIFQYHLSSPPYWPMQLQMLIGIIFGKLRPLRECLLSNGFPFKGEFMWTTFVGGKCSLLTHAQCVFPTKNRLIIYCLITRSVVTHKLWNMLFAILTAAGSSLGPSMTYLQLGCALLAPQKERLCGVYLSWQSFGLSVRIETRDALKAKPPP